MDNPSLQEEKLPVSNKIGTLAIDFGNTTTVVAFQGETDTRPHLVDLPPITKAPGEIPSLVWQSNKESSTYLIGEEVFKQGLSGLNHPSLSRNFKRLIGAPDQEISDNSQSETSAEKAGELLFKGIWRNLPTNLEIKRLVLTAPVETYFTYKDWLQKVCDDFSVSEIALVDEPTAAAMGAGLPPGSKLLVLDIGGSTIDMSLVALEGGEGRATPVAQLLRFDGNDISITSKQVLRCAKVLGKAGIRLGGSDIDRWIVKHLFPKRALSTQLLNAAERLKCRLSQNDLNPTEKLIETVDKEEFEKFLQLSLCRNELEDLLIERGLIKILTKLLADTLAGGRRNSCNLEDLHGVVIVGGGARIPLIKKWLKVHTQPAPLLTPPAIEAVAIGALSLTPGVTIKDILQYGVSLRFWDKKSEKHFWHPLFIAGQPWPTTAPLELILSASRVNQSEIELILGEPDISERHQVIYIEGIPTVQTGPLEPKVNPWSNYPKTFSMNPPAQPGEDCIRLKFNIDNQSNLTIEGIDLRTEEILEKQVLGQVR